MQYMIIGLDGTDEQAPARRAAARAAHIEMGDELLVEGNLWYGAAILDDEANMKGSMYMVDFDSEEKLQEWLDQEPYVVGNVWQDITIHRCSTRDPAQFNRPKEFFDERQGRVG